MKTRILAALCASSLLLAGCSAEDTVGQDAVALGGTFTFIAPGGQTDIRYPAEERKPLKDFSGKDMDGKDLKLSDFEGEIVVINAWGQWCGPCRSESDDMQEVHEKLQEQNVGTVLGVNVKDYQVEIAQDFMADNGLTYPSLYDPPFKTAGALGGLPASVIPTTIILDKQHRPAAVFLREVTAKDVLAVTDELAAEA